MAEKRSPIRAKGEPVISLGTDTIRLRSRAHDKAEAIRQAGDLLVGSGNIEPGYVASMMAREKVANTFLGNGIAIPHGLPKDRGLIRRTGIAVVQFPEGIPWNPGETVYLVVGIAARSDEHLDILSNLTDVLDDAEAVRRLARTDDPGDIVRRLNGGAAPAAAAPAPVAPAPEDFARFFDATVAGAHGLHARPATAFAEIAKRFGSEIRVRCGDKTANGKSLVSLLKLGAEAGAPIRVMAEGPDADRALEALRQALDHGLEDEAEAAAEAAAGVPPPAAAVRFEGRAVPGIAASPGLAIGPLRQFRRGRIVVEAAAKDPAAEETRLHRAIESARAELSDLFNEVWKRSGPAKAAIFRAHAEFLDDPELVADTVAKVGAGRSAGWAWQRGIEERAGVLESLHDPVVAGRAADLRDVGRRVLKLLADRVEEEPSLPDRPMILVAEDLTPSDTARLDPAFALGLCTAGGGPTSHTAIIARSLDIPAIVGTGPAALGLADDTLCILDGDGGLLVVEPTEADLAAARQARTDQQARREAERLACYEPAITTDGARIEVAANISDPAEAEQAVNAGGEGVGLLRTEFLFLQRDTPPDEDEQFAAYSTMTRALNGLPLIIRTLDIGGDKEVPYLSLPAESNPFLGERGIRLCLARPDLFRPQLRAIFRAAATGPVRIMYPMISTLEELAAARKVTEAVRLELGAAPVETGIMIEVPSAVMMAEEFAREVDFFSIGSNDLTQYVLAMDRLHPVLAKQADGLHPAVLRMIDRAVKAATAAGRWVGVCGGIAGDPRGVAILAGLGVAELSVSIPSIAAVKAQIRGLSMAAAKDLAGRALACRTAAEVRALR